MDSVCLTRCHAVKLALHTHEEPSAAGFIAVKSFHLIITLNEFGSCH